MRIARIVNAIPNDHSSETNDDSEPSLAVNPNNPHAIALLAFRKDDVAIPNGPIFFSTDAGESWSLEFVVPAGASRDQTNSFGGSSNAMYLVTVGWDDFNAHLYRVTGNAFSEIAPPRSSHDQPWVRAIGVADGPDAGKDRLYYSYNDIGDPLSARVDVFLDAASANPAFTTALLETRGNDPVQKVNGPAIRTAPNRDGTVYAAFQSRRQQTGSVNQVNIVVSRDDDWGKNSFADLPDPGDGLAGRIVASVTIDDSAVLAGERWDYTGLAVEVDPNDSDIVYVSWIDQNASGGPTLHVRRSTNRGVDWSGDLLAADNAVIASMAINTRGTVGLAYVQLAAGLWETHFRSTADGSSWDDLLLARTATKDFIGDYLRMVAVYHDFYGVFPAMNTPDPANFFPNGGGTVRFLRNTSGTQLLGNDGTTVVAPSLDPFFFKIQERECVVVTDRNTFGKEEIDALLKLAQPAVVDAAFYVTVDGFSANELGISAATFSGTPDVAPVIGFNPALSGVTAQATGCSAVDEANLDIPQRFTWTYQLSFSSDADFTAENIAVALIASITSNTNITVSGEAIITLTTAPNPYEIDGPTSWLSVDLQVFSLLQGGHLPSTPGIVLGADPIAFIQRLLGFSGGGYNDPGLPRAPSHPFDLDLVANEDTSTVTLCQGEGGFPPFVPPTPIHNFAVARVRYRALVTEAVNVRVFFRMFQAATTSTDFQPATTYATGGIGVTKVPLLGVVNGEVVSIPFFAEARVDPSQPDGLNAQTDITNFGPNGMPIPPDPSGNEVQVYFGCWLDINQTTPVLPDPNSVATAAGPYAPMQSIQQAIRGSHQCLVAEINLDPPEPQIAAGTTPASSDKLAQRNLTIVGVASPHQVPVTFDIKPTRASPAAVEQPDELMIDWGRLPHGAKGSIYLPGTSAEEILRMANRRYTRHGLSIADPHTLTCAARGITYLPIPAGIGANYAGLLTVDLPPVVKGRDGFKVLVRQITTASARRAGAALSAAAVGTIVWRRVLGSFQLSIPVLTRQALLEPEERLLSVLRWIGKAIPRHNRWAPVFERYLKQIAGRVSALGGDPECILPSPTGGGRTRPGPGHGKGGPCFTGKIGGLIFDRFGDFSGFLLDTEKGEREFSSREKDIAGLAERAWRERLTITVCVERHEPHRLRSIIVRKPPATFK